MMKLLFPILLLLLSNSIFAQRIIFPESRPRPIPTFRNQPIETKSMRVEATMDHHVAKVKIDQVFHNSSNRRIEGMYVFPFPKGMTIQNFTMEINGKPVNAELLSADKARKIYEDIVRRQVDPALMEYQDGGLIKLRIFPIAPKEDRRISLTFETELSQDNGLSSLELPIPNTKINQLILDLKIQTPNAIGSVVCPTHQMDIAYLSANNVHASAEVKNAEGIGKLQFYFARKEGMIDANFLSYTDTEGEQFFQLSLSPGFTDQKEIVAKDITFALDVSGSMSGSKLNQAKDALKYCINQLNKQDRFNIVRFATEATTLFPERQTATKAHIQNALQWIDQLKAAGGTNIYDALDMALSEKTNDRPEMIIFITDGRPTIGHTLPKKITDMVNNHLKGNRRIFSFGVGNDLNVNLLDKITDRSHGFRTYVSEQENIAVKVSNFYRKVASPVLTDLKITTTNNVQWSELQPKKLPDLFGGSTLVLFGKHNGKADFDMTLAGKINGQQKKQTYRIKAKPLNSNDYIPRLWASRKVAYLYDQIRLNGESKEVKDELISTAKKYGIITAYTSLLIIEDEADLMRRGSIGMDDAIWNRSDRALPPSPKKSATYRQAQSTEIQSSRVSSNLPQNNQEKLSYQDAAGNQRNLASDVQFVHGRAFYLQDRQWVDSNIQLNKKKLKEVKLIYASETYFQLLEQKEMQRYLGIGTNITFIHNNTKYIIEEG